MSSTDGLQRGMKVINTKAPISIPVGQATLGRIMNVLGEPVDEMGPVETENYLPIHRPSPKLVDQNTNVEIFETGIKAIDLLQPYQKGGKIGLFGGCRRWQNSIDYGTYPQHRSRALRCVCIRRCRRKNT